MITYALLNLKSIKNGGPVISPISPLVVIPVKTGIQWIQIVLDSGFRRSDGFLSFYETIKNGAVLITNERLHIFLDKIGEINYKFL